MTSNSLKAYSLQVYPLLSKLWIHLKRHQYMDRIIRDSNLRPNLPQTPMPLLAEPTFGLIKYLKFTTHTYQTEINKK